MPFWHSSEPTKNRPVLVLFCLDYASIDLAKVVETVIARNLSMVCPLCCHMSFLTRYLIFKVTGPLTRSVGIGASPVKQLVSTFPERIHDFIFITRCCNSVRQKPRLKHPILFYIKSDGPHFTKQLSLLLKLPSLISPCST